jgi:PPK2 family polyphosphate:nucleotide phosphotransferase
MRATLHQPGPATPFEPTASGATVPVAGSPSVSDHPVTPRAGAVSELLAVGEGFRLGDVDPASTPGFDGGKADGKRARAQGDDELSDLQERLFANGRAGGTHRLLLVLQGMDTAGKGGVMRHVVGAVDPQGVDHTAFAAPTEEEQAHAFLWRVRRALPRPGQLGVFDRSHHEDVLVARVHHLVPETVWSRRYGEINDFEAEVVAGGTTLVKVMLHVSREEQKKRLLRRLDRPDKHWKYDPRDIDERQNWDAYAEAYQAALTRCSTAVAPWFVVPADHKWYARWAVQQLLLEHLRALDLRWPKADVDVAAERERLLRT